MKFIATVLLFSCLSATIAFSQAQEVTIRTLGFKINVMNMEKAIDFYSTTLGFAIRSGDGTSKQVLLQTEDGHTILLNLVANLLPELTNEARAGFTLMVNNLDSAIRQMKAKNVNFKNSQKRKEGVGYAITIYDPFDTPISLMHQTITTVPSFAEPKIYNYGFLIPDMNTARDFYTRQLGFVVRSERYLPNDLPLGHRDNSFAFMLHYRSGVEAVQHNTTNSQHIVLLFQTRNLEQTRKQLSEAGVVFQNAKPVDSAVGPLLSFYDPFGYLSELVEIL